jgi:hypothetical protein
MASFRWRTILAPVRMEELAMAMRMMVLPLLMIDREAIADGRWLDGGCIPQPVPAHWPRPRREP